MIVPGSANALMLGQSQGYNLTKSLRFRSSASAYLNRTPASTGNRKTWTWSAWLKKSVNGVNIFPYTANDGSGGSNYDALDFTTGDVFRIYFQGGIGAYLVTSQVFRDPSAWYHLVVAVDTTQATAANRIKLYVNGSQVTAFSTSTYPSQNYDTYFNLSGRATAIGAASASPVGGFFNGYMTEVNFIDGQALTPSSFGSTNADTGVWQPAKYTGTYGTNGFYLPFTDVATTSGSNAGLGKDFSGNGNYWNTNNISVTSGSTYDSMTDVPTLTSATTANYCVMNPLDNVGTTVSNGNLQLTANASSFQTTRSTFAMPTGSWYCELTATTGTGNGSSFVGIALQSAALTTISGASNFVGASSTSWSYSSNGNIYNNNSVVSATGTTWASGSVIGMTFDGSTLKFYKNNTLIYTVSSIPSGTYCVATSVYSSDAVALNFGQQGFTYTPPTGFVALNTYNLPTSTIVQGNKYMDATLYTGNDTAGTNITNAAGFKPDLVWSKVRSGVGDNGLWDSVRGASNRLVSNTTSAEGSVSGVTAFNSNGFTLGAAYNVSPSTYVGWQWQAGQGTTSSNTNGSITSTVSVNASAGFSVVTFTGGSGNNTVGHGLGVAPNMVILKRRNSTSAWLTYHSALSNPATSFLELNTTSAVQSASPFWGASGMTSTTIGTSDNATINGATYVAYCWAEIAGFSKFGSYTGNGSTDGPFVYTGFRPKYVMIKRTDYIGDWTVVDTARSPYNYEGEVLAPNTSAAETASTYYTGGVLDGLSNGFKIRNGSGPTNPAGGTCIYMAFAENPFKNALAR